jgi:hypothetical protein
VARCDRVLAHDSAMNSHCRSLTPARTPEHLSSSLISFGLRVVKTGCAIRIVQFVHPFSVIATEYRSVILVTHLLVLLF